MKIFAFGDVHGNNLPLRNLINEAVTRYNPDLIIGLGDYVDRGPDTMDTVKFLRFLVEDSPTETILLRGNHEAMMMEESPNGYASWRFSGHGANETICSYPDDHSLQDDIKWLRDNTRIFYETEKHFFVHAGIDPHVHLSEQTEDTMLWIRDLFISYNGMFPKYVVHGHTPVRDVAVQINRCNLDTHCYRTGNLTGGLFDTTDENPKPQFILTATDHYVTERSRGAKPTD